MQVFLYFHNYDKDHWALKFLVAFVMALDTAGLGLLLKASFPVLILQWGRVAGLFETQVELLHRVYMVGLIAAIVQMFFLYRIYVFSGKKWVIPALLTPFVLYLAIGSIPYSVIAMQNPALETLHTARVMGISNSLRGVSCGVDILISGIMTYLLATKMEGTFDKTQKLLFRLAALSINSGMWTAVLALLAVITQVAYPDKLIFTVFEFPIMPLYVNALLANLNVRSYIKNESLGTQQGEWQSVNLGSLESRTVGQRTGGLVQLSSKGTKDLEMSSRGTKDLESQP
jgi:hypothetical protein